MLFNEENNAMKFKKRYGSMIPEAQKKATKRVGLKNLTPKQMIQILPITPAQVKVNKTSENFLNQICQLIKFLYQTKEITKKVDNNIMISIKL